jgi:outer membrane usher protein FimD/PapC
MKRLVLAIALALSFPALAEDTYLDVRINDRKSLAGVSVEFNELAPGLLATTPEHWRSVGIVLSAEEETMAFLSTRDLGLEATVDNATMTVNFTTPAGRLPLQILGAQEVPVASRVSPSAKGVMVAYDVAASYHPEGGVAASVGHLVQTNVATGVLTTTGQLNVSRSGSEYRRGYTTWTKDIPDKRLSFQVGDILTKPTGPSTSVNLAGVRVASDPALDPTQPSFPVPMLGGVAVAPSNIQAYLNGSPLQPWEVESGGFAYGNIGLSGGLNVGQVVITDKFGRQTVVDNRFYVSTDQLRKGLSRWEVNVGLLRDGQTDRYATPALSAAWARGLTDTWTMEAQVEATQGAQNVSLGSKVVLGHAGALGVTYGQSTSHKGRGSALAFDYSYQSRNWSVGMSHVQRDARWWELSQVHDSDRGPLTATSVFGSVRVNDHWTVAAAASRVQEGGMTRNRAELRADWSRDRSFLSMSLAREGDDNQIRLTYSRPFGNMDGAVDVSRTRRGNRMEARLSGDRDTTLGAMRWNARLGDSGGTRYGSAAARWDNPRYDASLRLDVYNGDPTVSVGYSSGFWIGEGVRQQVKSQGTTLAVVKVGDVEGVPVYLENQLVGKTNAQGTLVVGPVHQLIPNHFRIDERALPLGVEVASTEMEGVPNRNSVALVEFKLTAMQARAFTLRLPDGTYPSLGAALTSSTEESMVGYDGGIYLEQPEGGQTLTVTHAKGTCVATIPAPLPAFDETADLECK